MASFLESVIDSIKVRTTYGPDFVINDPFRPDPAPSPILRVMKPTIEIGIRGGSPIVIAPAGRAPPTRWPLIVGALTVGAGVSIGLLGLGVYSLVASPPRRTARLAGLSSRPRRVRRGSFMRRLPKVA